LVWRLLQMQSRRYPIWILGNWLSSSRLTSIPGFVRAPIVLLGMAVVAVAVVPTRNPVATHLCVFHRMCQMRWCNALGSANKNLLFLIHLFKENYLTPWWARILDLHHYLLHFLWCLQWWLLCIYWS
jgi:hypothetical protein